MVVNMTISFRSRETAQRPKQTVYIVIFVDKFCMDLRGDNS